MQETYKSLTRSTENLLSVFLEKGEVEKAAPKIQVNRVVSKLAFLYEKIRNVIEYKEEHLLRKNAIKRILKRRLTWKSNAKSIAAPLIYELIRGRYLENNAVLENKIKEYGLTILVALLVLVAGLAAVNYYLEFRYKAVFLSTPCQLCADLNPLVEDCLSSKVEINRSIVYFNASSLSSFISVDNP